MKTNLMDPDAMNQEAFIAEVQRKNPYAEKTFNLTYQLALENTAPELAKHLKEQAVRGDNVAIRLDELQKSIEKLTKALEEHRNKTPDMDAAIETYETILTQLNGRIGNLEEFFNARGNAER